MKKKIGMKINQSMGYIMLDIEIDENDNVTVHFYGDGDRELYDSDKDITEPWVDADSPHLGGFEYKVSSNGEDVFDDNFNLKK